MQNEIDLGEYYADFREDLLREAEFSGDPQRAVFFRRFAELAAENGDTADMTYAPAKKEVLRASFEVDGYAWDPERGELNLAVCDYHPDPELQKINLDRVDRLFKRVARFCESAIDPDFVYSLEESDDAFELATLVSQAQKNIVRIRCTIFSNARLATVKKTIEEKQVIGAQTICNVFDFARYATISHSQGGAEPIELDVKELNGRPLPCLEAHDESADCRSYLAVMPGSLLARAYGLYGSRLMEQNVRTFLQAKTKTNKGIIETASKEPDMFFAYNNGITATASGLELERDGQGTLCITKIQNLQIVNGGQTTASLLYASDRGDAELSRIFVQMKLSVVEPEKVVEIVPRISRYANTQNKVSEADFFSNHEFHQEMQRISRRLDAPRAAGSLASTRWYYERTRGQYKNDGLGRTATDRKRFEALYPKDQVIQKTYAAKYVMAFEPEPQIVSKGEQKCFVAFAEKIDAKWRSSRSLFGDLYFKDLVAKAIIFRWLDRAVGRASWYPDYRSLKAVIVTYTLGWLVYHLKENLREIDFDRTWSIQEVPEELKSTLDGLAPQVALKLKEYGSRHGNVTEYAKTPTCWAMLSKCDFEVSPQLKLATIGFEQSKSRTRTARSDGALDLDIGFDTMIVKNLGKMAELELVAKRKSMLSPKSSQALRKLARGNIDLTQSERSALKYLVERVTQLGALPIGWFKDGEDD